MNIQKTYEVLNNIYSGVRYTSVFLHRKYKHLDLGVKVIRFDRRGRCLAQVIEFSDSASESTKALSLCFKVPFTPGIYVKDTKTYIQHPTGWLWITGAKRLTINAALNDWHNKSMTERYVGGKKYNRKKYIGGIL